jgi:hypothetical protein
MTMSKMGKTNTASFHRAGTRTLRALLFWCGCVASLCAAETWKVGDKVEAWNSAWYPAEIISVGTGEHAGQFMVHYDGFSKASDQWIFARNIRARPAAKTDAAKAAETAAGPRPGKYGVYSYGAPPSRIYLGDIELAADGTYRANQPGGKSLGEGKYRYDAPNHMIIWMSGPYHGSEWGGAFEVSREGKTHTIRLRRSTIATNSLD